MYKLKKYFGFKGRAKRTEFWIIIFIVYSIILGPAFYYFEPYSYDAWLYIYIAEIVTAWPYIAVQVRRWHDRNKSGWWFFINFVPVIGILWVIVESGLLPSVNEDNMY